MTLRALALAGVLLSPAAAGDRPPEPAEVAAHLAARCEENLRLLAGRSWTSRTEIRKKGKLHTVRVETVRVIPDGTLERELVRERGPALKQGAGAERQKHKIARLYAWVARLTSLLDGYVAADRPCRVAETPRWAVVGMPAQGPLRIAASGVVQPHDRVTLWVRADSWETFRSHVFTTIDNDDVTMETEYRRLAGGPAYPVRRSIHVPSERVEIRIDNDLEAEPDVGSPSPTGAAVGNPTLRTLRGV